MNVPISRTCLNEAEMESVLETLRSGWLVQGPKVEEFEQKWSAFTGAAHSIAVTSATSALHLSLAALGVGPNDEVIVPAFTWVATANIVENLGAKVVFCDIDLTSFNLDVDQLEDKITSHTRGIIPVHLFGLGAEIDAVMQVAAKNNLWVVEDAACGFGTKINGQHVGTFGHTGCFSFHPRKSITTGEGGMITTEDPALAAKLRSLRNHGAAMSQQQHKLSPRPYLLADHPLAGYNQRMTDIQGALGSTQMDRAAEIITERKHLADVYNKAFAKLPWLQTPLQIPANEHSYQSYACLYQSKLITSASIKNINKERNAWMDELQNAGISTRPATHAVHMLSFYRKKYRISAEDFPNAFAANECSLSLPLFHGMTDQEQSYVIDCVLRKE